MMMHVKQSEEWLEGETEVPGENQPSAILSITKPT
jgi:hypothetical protein